ncbi:MAG TPA: BON domain-containing protein [Polyangiaceae bacterium]|nr:BON domain-containing protein [Polyangiaceae bacterium]
MTNLTTAVTALALAACTSATPVVTTTSAESPSASRREDQVSLHASLPREEPAPANPRVERDLDIAEDRARERDRKISDGIVRGIVNDTNLSPSAKRVDVTTQGRHVTLRGEVPTGQERQEIDAMARFAPDVLDVDDRIRVVP